MGKVGGMEYMGDRKNRVEGERTTCASTASSSKLRTAKAWRHMGEVGTQLNVAGECKVTGSCGVVITFHDMP